MNAKFRVLFATALFLTFISISGTYAQGSSDGPKVGGWSKISTKDPGVIQAADFAVRQHSQSEPVTLKKILSAQIQIVAGTNYKLLLLVLRNGHKRKATVVVWHKLDGTFELTSWQWVGRKKK